MRRLAAGLAFVGAAAGLVGVSAATACTLHASVAGAPLDVRTVSPFGELAAAGTPLAPLAPLAVKKPVYRLRAVGHAAPPGGYTADVWAHRGFAYLSSWGGPQCPSDGVRVFALSNPRRPAAVATFAHDESDPRLAGTWTEKTIVKRVATPSFVGDLAVTSFQNCRTGAFRGFGLYDVTNPRAPRQLSIVRTDPRGSHEIWLQQRGSAVYVYTAIINSELLSAPDYDPQTGATIPGRPDFRIFDVSNPTAPAEIGSWGAWRELGIHPNPSRDVNHFVHSAFGNAAGTRAYLSYWDLGTVILDTSDVRSPRYLGRTPETEAAHSAWLGRSGRLLVETHETSGGTPTLFDVSNPARPKRLSEIRIPAVDREAPNGGRSFMNGVHDPEVAGDRAYFSWYSQGVIAAGVAKPTRPRVLAQWLPPAGVDPNRTLCGGGSCRVVWGVAVYGRYVLASDMLTGLWVLRLERRR